LRDFGADGKRTITFPGSESEVTSLFQFVDHIDLHCFARKSVSQDLEWTNEILSTDERARAKRFVFNVHADRFRFRRALMRIVLAHYMDVEPASIEFVVNAWGKPDLAPDRHGAHPIRFNLSHSADAMMIGIRRQADVGVDIESHRDIPELESMARMVMHRDEWNAWQGLTSVEKPTWFFNLWAMKEAVMKCVGCGLALEPSSFCVKPMVTQGEPQRIDVMDPQGERRNLVGTYVSSFPGFSSATARPFHDGAARWEKA
jgi:phosphopantetheinyl transferase